jgi:hypothetical protein
MKTAKTLLTLAIGLALALTCATPAVADDDGGDAKITPVVTVAPTNVPAGKRLVIEHVSAVFRVGPGNHITQLQIIAQPQSFDVPHFLIPIFTGNDSNGASKFSASQPIKVYAAPGTAVSVWAFKSSGLVDTSCTFAISGHLVSLP